MSAPNVVSAQGTSANGSLRFLDESKLFDPANTPGNYHLNSASSFGDGFYFYDYYNWAQSIGQNELTAFSAKTWCAEFSVLSSSTNCSSSKKSYFRIASNYWLPGAVLQSGGGIMEPGLSENTDVFPNPTFGVVNFTLGSNADNTVILINNLGQVVRKAEHIKDQQYQMNISNLAAGVYLYQVQSGDKVKRGKLVKK